jgi:N-dimethylarginine dimethylaminohydrolase
MSKANNLVAMTPPRKVLLCPPDYFDVVDEKNVHMKGQQGQVNKPLARQQWQALRVACDQLAAEGLIEEVAEVQPTPGCEDMVFCANPALPWRDRYGKLKVVLSKMTHPSRQKEVAAFEEFFAERGYEILRLQSPGTFEGMGDCILSPSQPLLFGGYGFRTTPRVYDEISDLLTAEIILLEMINPNYYHLDTCLLPLGEDVCLIPPKAFSRDALGQLEDHFHEVIPVPDNEAMTLSLNAMVVFDEKPVAIMQSGCRETAAILRDVGIRVLEIDTSEFLKSGGSVFCMKLMYW